MSVPPPPEFLDIWGQKHHEPAGKYSRPPFTDPEPRRQSRKGWDIGTMSFWFLVVWMLALTAAIIWGPKP
jgi:hypothetical protein